MQSGGDGIDASIVVYTGESRRSGSLILPLTYDHAGLPGIW